MVDLESDLIPKVVLSSSVGHLSMPVLRFGTASDSSDSTHLKTAAFEAIKLGYRHFDTGMNSLSLPSSGAMMLIPTLVYPCSTEIPSLEYLDLYLVHWPISAKPGKGKSPIKEEEIMPMDYKSVWAAKKESQRLSLTKSIGVSIFSTKKLQNLLSFATIPPAKKLTEFCKANNIMVTAYSPLEANGTTRGSNHVINNQVLKDIAVARGKTIAQASLRWIYEQEATSVPKSYNKEMLKENLDIFDWKLTQEGIHKINQLPQKKIILHAAAARNETDPKLLKELWDGEF
ncbi:hypothetical protein FEM48_Zijuj01G0179900 [Ziziphus jujuba var. spinosa]|uniref:NADP-dependent oxidoreductase domain-containing protein n=1 Tax=Ziziphus jujuba var. spinosa TaxID=714518 RepID=A0A978W2R1_ZIZJJ|nr:hypothetical protein FEM48_Zijuj01G0179900 [Ziziphus jujuba var. spinosa]